MPACTRRRGPAPGGAGTGGPGREAHRPRGPCATSWSARGTTRRPGGAGPSATKPPPSPACCSRLRMSCSQSARVWPGWAARRCEHREQVLRRRGGCPGRAGRAAAGLSLALAAALPMLAAVLGSGQPDQRRAAPGGARRRHTVEGRIVSCARGRRQPLIASPPSLRAR